ncbi:hypothetical protein B0T25DRAFT_236452 [Lasiosphaeria hispida]|uniref:BZIP domain-containing protein n=1 Tax=Lasiosphaeria hispida TaxID=260671 RepID=A0AAJ0HEK3_9PEZI|nr:hypothetical protein B0T25DRAFT_236452 [Lasiosphaeria hispida]
MEPFPDGSLSPFDPSDVFLPPADLDDAAPYMPLDPLDFPLQLGDWGAGDDFSPPGMALQQDATLSATFLDPNAPGLPLGLECDQPLAYPSDWYDENAPLWIPSPYQHGTLVPTPGYEDRDSAVRDWPGPSPLGSNIQRGDGEYFGAPIDSGVLSMAAGLAPGTMISAIELPPDLPTSPDTQIAFYFDESLSKKEKKKRGRPRYYVLQDDNDSASPATIPSPSPQLSRRASTFTTVSSPSSSGNPIAKPKVNAQERNRKASSARHRNKTQVASDELEGEEREARTQNESLRACAHHLRNEVLELRSQVLQQASCGCPMIEGYISTQSQRVARTMTHDAVGHSSGDGESESR